MTPPSTIPVVSPTTSILEPTVGVAFEFVPYASNSPTSWSVVGTLPDGFTIGTGADGTISGTPTTEGVADFGLIATNDIGDSFPPTMITMGIMPGSGDIITDHTNPALLGMNCIIDVTSGEVSFPGATGASPTATTTESPLASIIEGDDVLFYVQFQKKGLYIDLGTIASDGLEIALKEFEPEATIIIGNTHIKSGTGEDATYILYAKAESVALAASLSNYEDDVSTNFTAVAQIRWKAPNATGIGPNPLVKTSQLFPLEIVRNVAP